MLTRFVPFVQGATETQVVDAVLSWADAESEYMDSESLLHSTMSSVDTADFEKYFQPREGIEELLPLVRFP